MRHLPSGKDTVPAIKDIGRIIGLARFQNCGKSEVEAEIVPAVPPENAMLASVKNPPSLPPPKKRSELNARLTELGLPVLSSSALKKLTAQEPIDRIMQALVQAEAQHAGGLAYLIRVINAASETTVSGEASTPSAPPRHLQPVSDAEESGSDARPSAPEAASFTPAPGHSIPEPASPAQNQTRLSVHVYGQKAALCFEPTLTRSHVPTLTLDAALAQGQRQYDWGNKLRLQLTRQELPMVAAVLLGFRPKCEFTNHGDQNNKGFSIEDQGQHVFIRVFAKDQPVRAVPVTPEDAFRITTLLLRQLQSACPWLTGGDLISLISRTVGRVKTPGRPS
ncbi:MAG: hypothetical protein V2J55_06690 [Candidatus Competibacteraceae bacterium]|jgi:hypothetical protein|nr:hypothetical protein [Candidatus Competibacteraceae bacterium]